MSVVGAGQPWAYDPDWLAGLMREPENLLKILVECGCARPVGAMPLPVWWWSLPPEVQFFRRTHGLVSSVATCMWMQTRPDSGCLLLVHLPTGQWWQGEEPHTHGPTVLSLVQHRLDLTPAKAAWRVAKVLGFEKPIPPVAPA